jgi:hypothetical protein
VTGLKVHLREVRLNTTTYRVVSLRPATRVRFSTNYFHSCWHVLTGAAGADVLARLLWGLAFQREPGTLVLIDAPHLVPAPFEADRADPIAILPGGLTRFDPADLRTLRRRLASTRPFTIRWHTFGMSAAWSARGTVPNWRYWNLDRLRTRERMSRTAGWLCYTAPAETLRQHALEVLHMTRGGEGYLPLAAGRANSSYWAPEGEIQILGKFDRDVVIARQARREVLRGEDRPLRDDDEREAVWDHHGVVAARGGGRRGRRHTSGLSAAPAG